MRASHHAGGLPQVLRPTAMCVCVCVCVCAGHGPTYQQRTLLTMQDRKGHCTVMILQHTDVIVDTCELALTVHCDTHTHTHTDTSRHANTHVTQTVCERGAPCSKQQGICGMWGAAVNTERTGRALCVRVSVCVCLCVSVPWNALLHPSWSMS